VALWGKRRRLSSRNFENRRTMCVGSWLCIHQAAAPCNVAWGEACCISHHLCRVMFTCWLTHTISTAYRMFSRLHQARLAGAWRHYVLTPPPGQTGRCVETLICSQLARSLDRSFICLFTKLVNTMCWKLMDWFWCKLAQVIYGQWHEMVNFGGQEVKGQGHTRPKVDLETAACSTLLHLGFFPSVIMEWFQLWL